MARTAIQDEQVRVAEARLAELNRRCADLDRELATTRDARHRREILATLSQLERERRDAQLDLRRLASLEGGE